MGLQVYSTLSRKKESFETLEANKVRMYVCGPTVYDKAHVGHAMSALVFDIIRRYLEYRGYSVNHVMNYTDVDDKIINRANKLACDPFELAESYIQQYAQHLKDLNILPATLNPRLPRDGRDHPLITDLIDKGSDYEADGDVYFRRRKKRITAHFPAASWMTCAPGPALRWMTARKTRWISRCGKRPRKANPPGTARGAKAAPAGISNARP